MANDKKIRLSFTAEELTEIYAALGARSGMLRDGAAIKDLRPSEYAPQVATIAAIQDRIFNAIHDKGEDAPASQSPLSLQEHS